MKLTTTLLLLSLSLNFASPTKAEETALVAQPAKPNILIIIADDCTYNDLPVYGGLNARTPHLDTLASQGLVFNCTYVSMAMCQPCRSELYSGQLPLRNGCAWNHSASRPGTRSLPHYLGAQGYRVGIAGKTMFLPVKCFPFENVPGFDPNCAGNPTKPHKLDGIRKFMTRKADQPFCLVVGLVEPHVPWVMGDVSKYPAKQIKLPANLADTPRTRADFARYLAEVTYMDGQVGDILATLKATGRENDTLVLFTSEQGSQFPGNKWTCWDTGLHTALMARWPGKIAAGKRTDALVQYADVAPTLLELAGGHPASPAFVFDGSSFTAVLRGEKETHRIYTYGLHNNLPEGPAYPSRTVSDGRWRYIRNLTPGELYIQKYIMGHWGNDRVAELVCNPYWATWVGTCEEIAATHRLIKRYMLRPAEELYDSLADPYEMNNLASDTQHAEIKTKLAAELDRWMAEQGDPGVPLDTEDALQSARHGNHKYFTKTPQLNTTVTKQ